MTDPSTSLALPLRDASEPRASSWPWAMTQRGLAALGMLVLSPVFGAVYLAVRLSSPGPALFRQLRPGLLGDQFTVFKFRTLRLDSEKATGLGVTQANSNITRVGRLLRELKLDELPQLWNVVRGDMEIVGPRPLPIPLHDTLCQNIPGFSYRYRVKPGLSNISQVSVADNGVGDRLIKDWSQRFEGEMHYVQRKCFGYDAAIIFMTMLFVLRRLLRRTGSRKRVERTDASFTNVIGTRIANLDYEGVIDRISGWVRTGKGRFICICPVHSLVEARWRADHRRSLEASDLNTADGMPVVWAQKLFGHRDATRVYGPTLMLETLAQAEASGWRIALYGGRPDRNEVLVERLQEQFPRLRIVSVISPPFRPLTDEEDADITARLAEARPDIVWVGLGCPRQEAWMRDHVDHLDAVLIGVGAAFDFHAGAVPQSPALLQRWGLEWAFRLACEPRRLIRRYATTNPAYCWLLARQWIAGLGRRFRAASPLQFGGTA